MVKVGSEGVYTGGKGVLLRSMYDLTMNNTQVVVASLVVDDIHVPNVLHPTEGPNGKMCPNNGDSGYTKAAPCPPDANKETGPWNYAQLAVVVGSNMSHFFHEFDSIQSWQYDFGVFYGSDANAADKRCRYVPEWKGYDCPGYWMPWLGNATKDASKTGASQFAPGNPWKNASWGGGSGCHFADYNPAAGIDQTDAYDAQDRNLVSDRNCQCNVALRSGGEQPWDAWVDQWLKFAKAKPGSEWQKWFGGGKAPSFALDFASCWMNNPRDMITMQNAIWKRSGDWSNQKIPASNWQLNATTQRSYWGWNEVPVSVDILKPQYWDAIVIKLPLAVCGNEGGDDTVSCLTRFAQGQLEFDLSKYVTAGYLKVGRQFAGHRPGSSVVFLREVRVEKYTRWTREFFCEPWTGPAGKFKVVKTAESCVLESAVNVTAITKSSIIV